MSYCTYFIRIGGILLLYATVLFAQPPQPLDFFPHHQGDVWEYWYQENPPTFTIAQNIITKDSLGDDGRYYLETSLFDYFVVDTTTHEVYNYFTPELTVGYKLYKLNADSGDVWTVIQGPYGRWSARMVDVYPILIFGQLEVVKVIENYQYQFGDPESLWVRTDYLASHFGLIQRDAEFAFPEYLLKGAIIDGVLYGTVPIDEADTPEIPEQFILHQNYPNPFNPTTTIEYELPAATKVELTVYDLMGRKVKTLVNARQPAGSYQVQFDGSQLSSGVYVYRLKTGKGFVISKRMVLLK